MICCGYFCIRSNLKRAHTVRCKHDKVRGMRACVCVCFISFAMLFKQHFIAYVKRTKTLQITLSNCYCLCSTLVYSPRRLFGWKVFDLLSRLCWRWLIWIEVQLHISVLNSNTLCKWERLMKLQTKQHLNERTSAMLWTIKEWHKTRTPWSGGWCVCAHAEGRIMCSKFPHLIYPVMLNEKPNDLFGFQQPYN